MRVLLTCPPLPAISGVSAYYRAVEHHIAAAGVEITPIEIGSLGPHSFHPIRDQLSFMHVLRNTDVDLVHINPSLAMRSFLRDGLFARAAGRRDLPVLSHFHGWEHGLARRMRRGPLLRFFRSTYARTDSFIVLANEFRDKLMDWGVDGPVSVGTTAVADGLLDGFDIGERLEGLSTVNAVNALFLARIERDKGIYETIEACAALVAEGRRVRLSVAGDGSELEKAKDFASSVLGDNVRFLGFVSGRDKAAVFRDSNIYILPTSHAEGMPASVLEALAFGIPVIARPMGGLRDFFVDGEHGYLTDSTDPGAITSLIRSVITDVGLWRKMSVAAHEYAVGRFLGSMVASRVVDVYRAILTARGKPA